MAMPQLELQDYRDRRRLSRALLSSAWTEADYAQLWDDVLNLRQVKNALPEIGKQQNTTFNRQLVARILHVMKDRGVFAAKVTDTGMAETLEGNPRHSVRLEIGHTIEDRTLKSAIADLIEPYSRQKS